MRKQWVAIATAISLLGTSTSVPARVAAPAARATFNPATPIATEVVRPIPAPPDPAAADTDPPPKVSWPAAASAEVSSAGHASVPVRLGKASKVDRVRVEVLGQDHSTRLGLTGVLLRVRRADGIGDPGTAVMELDYQRFRAAAGGGFGARLRLLRLAACALQQPSCSDAATQPIESRNSVTTSTLSAEVELTGQDSLFAVAAAPDGSTGSFAASKLNPSAQWQVGLSSGDFSWSYPLEVPQLPGPDPQLAISYSSGRVDGRMGSSNNQPSWVGEGFELSPGYIERSYRTCKKDTGGSVPSTDLCWVSNNATVSLPGVDGQLIRDDATGVWKVADDSG